MRGDDSKVNMKMRSKGFTLIEIVVAIGVVAILAAMLAPVILGQIEKSRVAVEMRSIAELGKTFRRFHDDTGGWPYLSEVWDIAKPKYSSSGGVDPTRFTAADRSLHAQAGGLPLCSVTNIQKACWNGPYMGQGASLGDVEMRDSWGNMRLFAIIPPEPYGGSVPSAKNGAVIIWSSGPDGIDQTGCTNGGCTWDKAKTARGEPSVAGSDDIVLLVNGVY